MKPTIIISAGGTGGHIFPALAIAKELAEQYNIIWVGAKTGLENEIVPKNGFTLETVSVAGVRNKGVLRKLKLPMTLLKSGLECCRILRKYKPVAVVGFGGYATFPICASAQLFAIPVVIHEQNSVAGLTNKLSAKFAKKVLTAFPNVLPSSKTSFVGNPIRNEILQTYSPTKYSADKLAAGIRVLIVGGSLGAKVLNEVVPVALGACSQNVLAVTHQVGKNGRDEVLERYAQSNLSSVQVVNFIDDMAAAFRDHDLIICRSGASTVTEVAAAGIVAIFVPYPYAVDDHQTTNAQYLSDAGGAFLLQQESMTAPHLAQMIDGIELNNYQHIAEKAHAKSVVNSTQLICEQIIAVIKK